MGCGVGGSNPKYKVVQVSREGRIPEVTSRHDQYSSPFNDLPKLTSEIPGEFVKSWKKLEKNSKILF